LIGYINSNGVDTVAVRHNLLSKRKIKYRFDSLDNKIMTHIYCTKKMESFLGTVEPVSIDMETTNLGNWNGHLFTIDRRKNLIFTNDKTAYSFVLLDVVKKDVKDFGTMFRESLLRQLDNDLKINEQQEIKLRRELRDIRIHSTNNNKKIIGTINECVYTIKTHAYLQGGLNQLTSIKIGQNLNDNILRTKLALNDKQYFHPKDLMKSLLT